MGDVRNKEMLPLNQSQVKRRSADEADIIAPSKQPLCALV